MKFKGMICVLLSALIMTAGFTGCTQKEKTAVIDSKTIEFTTTQLNELEAQIDYCLTSNNYYGAAQVMLNKNKVYDRCIGVSDNLGTKATGDTVYHASSMTTVFTGVAIYQLIDQHKLTLDTTLDKFFGKVKHFDKITIGQLLNGTVRLVNYVSSLSREVILEIRKAYEKKDDDRIIKLIGDHILTLGIANRKSTIFSNYYLLGLIIQQVSGMSYKEYIKKNIFDKVGMKNSGFIKTGGHLKGFDTNNNHWRNHGEINIWGSYGFCFSTYGITTTANDLIKFCTALMYGKLTKTDVIKTVQKAGADFNCGLTTSGHSVYMSARTYIATAYVIMNPEDRQTVLLISNYTGKVDINSIAREIARIVKSKINGIVLNGA